MTAIAGEMDERAEAVMFQLEQPAGMVEGSGMRITVDEQDRGLRETRVRRAGGGRETVTTTPQRSALFLGLTDLDKGPPIV